MFYHNAVSCRKRAFLKEDNSFVFQGLPSGTYLVELEHPDYLYEPVRVDINSKGKHRARKNNFVQPNQVAALPYPVKMKPQVLKKNITSLTGGYN